MIRTLFAGLTLLATSSAIAQETQDVTLPTGRTIAAEVVRAPATGSMEHALFTTLTTVVAGDFDTFFAGQCDPTTCADPLQQQQLRTYNLPSAQRSGGSCLHGDTKDTLIITKRKEAPGGLVTVYLWCGASRLPAPSTWGQVDGSWRTSSFSW
jgi:hypothetical protein